MEGKDARGLAIMEMKLISSRENIGIGSDREKGVHSRRKHSLSSRFANMFS